MSEDKLFNSVPPKVNFFSVDAIESMYLLQNRIYGLLFPHSLVEYFHGPKRFQEIISSQPKGGVFHLPTWSMGVLPQDYFDLIICVHVLQELNEPTLHYTLQQFQRIAKKGCLLYIRDDEFWRPAHKVIVARELTKLGWRQVIRYRSIYGSPRLWVFAEPDSELSLLSVTLSYLSRWALYRLSLVSLQ